MTIMEAITATDNLKHNTYTQDDKIRWLSTLDHRVKKTILDTHEGEQMEFSGYGTDTPMDTVLLIPEPYDEIYLRWLEAQIDYANGEYGKYNNSIQVFNDLWEDFRNYYNRTHRPIRRQYRYF